MGGVACGNLVGIRGHHGEVIENSNSGGLSRTLLQRGAKRDAGGQPAEEVESRGVFVLFCFPFKWETRHVCVFVDEILVRTGHPCCRKERGGFLEPCVGAEERESE